jgi:ATP-dependent Clp protease adapter protein ClpS
MQETWINGVTTAPERTTTILPRSDEDTLDSFQGDGFLVVVYDNEVNTFDEVMLILQKATGCSLEEAAIETWEVHYLGKSVVHHGGREECERAAGIIRTIGIRVEVVED